MIPVDPDTRARRPRRIAVAAVLAAATMAGALAACSSSGDAAGPTTAPTTAGPAFDPTSTAPPATERPPPPPLPYLGPKPRTQRSVAPVAVPDRGALDRAITRAAGYLGPRFDDAETISKLWLANVGETFGFADLAGWRPRALDALEAEPDPGLKLVWLPVAMYRRQVWPDAPVREEDLAALTQRADTDWVSSTQWLIATASICGTPGFPDDWAARTRRYLEHEDPIGYVATHAAFGYAIIKERGCTIEGEDALRQELVPKVLAQIPTPFVPTDPAMEAVLALDLLGRTDAIDPAWIDAIVAAQHADGSWASNGAGPQSGEPGNWHPTMVALWLLASVRQPDAAGPFFS